MLNRKTHFSNSEIKFIREDNHYVVVTKNPNVNIVTRTYDEDRKTMVDGITVQEWCKKYDLVYSVFDVPAIDGKLLVYTTNGDPHRIGMTMSEHEDFARVVRNEYNLPYMFYGEMKEVNESGYVLMFGRTISDKDFISDDFCERLDLTTSNPDVTWHYYKFDDHEVPDYDIDLEICTKYELDRDNMMGLYVSNCNQMSRYAFLEFYNWNIIPGSAYSKHG